MTTTPTSVATVGVSSLTCSRLLGLLLLALVPTVLNALQPLVIDDGVYYLNARHILSSPLDPYGGTLRFWGLEIARMSVLSPPFVPYWWALAMAMVGDSVPLAKLTLYPFVVLLTIGIDALARRFAHGAENLAVALVVLSPWILPSLNLMLDVPALGLGVAALALFLRSCDRDSDVGALLAGLLAGLAIETKYNMVTIPAVMLLYGVCARRLVLALIAAGTAAAVFAGTEAALWVRYGESHFLAAAHGASGRSFSGVRLRQLFYGLFGNTGPVAVALVPTGILALGAPLRRVRVALAVCAVAMLVIAIGGDAWPAVLIPAIDAAKFPTVLHLSGLLGIAVMNVLARTSRQLVATGRDPVAWFLVAWLLIEIIGYFTMSPFPAVRRSFGLLIVATLILCRGAVPRVGADSALRRWSTAIAAFSVMAGLGIWLIGCVDATNTRALAQAAAVRAKAEVGRHRAWIWGHLAVDHHAVEAGLAPIVLERSELTPGDVVVVSPRGLETLFRWDLSALEPIVFLTAGTNLGVGITPAYFFGQRPIVGAADSRPQASLYRVKAATTIHRMRN